MPLEFSSPVYWDAFIDEHRGILEVAARENHYTGESPESINKRVHRAIRIIMDTHERFVPFKGKEYYSNLSQDEIWRIRQLLGFIPIADMQGILKYG